MRLKLWEKIAHNPHHVAIVMGTIAFVVLFGTHPLNPRDGCFVTMTRL
jgi:hypothetical protein